MKFSNSYLFSLVFFMATFSVSMTGQEIWSLEKCVSYAIEKSLQVEGSSLSLQSTEIDVNQARHARYPNLSASTNVGWNFGRTIDPTRNEFITETFYQTV